MALIIKTLEVAENNLKQAATAHAHALNGSIDLDVRETQAILDEACLFYDNEAGKLRVADAKP